MSKQVFISYAANDSAWPQERVMGIADWLASHGLTPLLDVRHVGALGRNLSPAEWREWMAECVNNASHIICLCSERYQDVWSRRESVSGGCGVAFESSRIESGLYDQKQNNGGRILTLSLQAGRMWVPPALKDACPDYVWGVTTDDQRLASHLRGDATLVGRDRSGAESAAPIGRVPSAGKFSHQAAKVEEHMREAPHLWDALSRSNDLKGYLGNPTLVSAGDLVRALQSCNADGIRDAMYEIRETLADVQRDFPSDDEVKAAAKATVTLYMFCACLLVKSSTPSLICGLPQLDSDAATHLLASVIGLSLAGGYLELVTEPGAALPRGTNTRVLNLTSQNPEASFERELYNLLVLDQQAVQASLKLGALNESERKKLEHRLLTLRGKGARTKAFAVVVQGDRTLDAENIDIARRFELPIFTFRNDPTFEFLAGVSAEDIVAMIGELWRVVRIDLMADNGATTPSQATSSRAQLDQLVAEIRTLTLSLKDQSASAALNSSADQLQAAAKDNKPPERDVLKQTKDTLEGLEKVGEAGEKLLPRLLQLLNLFM